MSTYLIINIIIIFIPLAVTIFERWMSFYKKLPQLFISIIIVGGVYIFWDILATNAGHWSFNELHVSSIYLFSIPIEESLFFVTVPFSCLFTYEAIGYFLNKLEITNEFDKRRKRFLKYLVSLAIVVFSGLSIFIVPGYTRIVLLITAIEILLVWSVNKDVFLQKQYWIFIVITFVLFFIFNYWLTSVPVVEYGQTKILNVRVTTIPVEDFLYNWGMLTTYLLVYLAAGKFLKRITLSRS